MFKQNLIKNTYTYKWTNQLSAGFLRGHWGQLTTVTVYESAVTAAYSFHLYHSSVRGWEDQSCQNQTRAFKNWDRTKLPKHGENAQVCHQVEKKNERKQH